MPPSRLLTLFAGITLILGLTIWLITSISWLYSQVLWSAPPFVANLLLLLLVALIALLIWAFLYYMRIFDPANKSAKRRRKPSPKVPLHKTEAASENLKAVRKQVEQIQDEVARQALLSRSREIQASMARGDLRVVVFGTGSAGKTSVINALFGRMVGRVGAPMGTTDEGATYCLKLKGVDRDILITDTPGILEAGVAGKVREELARSLATEADLLLFVVDNDLRKSEYQPLRILAEIGKRSIVVFNKSDLYPEADREAILARLRSRVQGFVSAMDVVAIAAHPQPVYLENGGTFELEPDIMPLIRRMAAIMRSEGEDLIADNILLQSHRLGEEARKLIENQRRRQAEKVVDRFQWIGAGAIACTPLPVVDLLATAAVNAQMVIEIGKVYGADLDMETGRELALSLAKTLASLGIVEGAIKLVSTALQLNVSTFVIGKAIQGISAAYLTRIAGKSFIEYFRHDRDWGDGGITEVVQRQFALTRKDEFVKSFMKDAIAKVVEPLKLDLPEPETIEEEYEYLEIEEQPRQYYDDWSVKRQRRDDW